ncbi:conserved hypothetical protein [Tenacibaculum sp. 190524A05c]|uniref:hypothetical protein n=1 Tax=Tenacibaculum platacis TaxID=3137852 RepID=UPI0031FB45C8
MKKFKNTQFAEGASKLSFADFKKAFSGVFNSDELKEAYKVVKDNGNTTRTTKSSKKAKSSKDK